MEFSIRFSDQLTLQLKGLRKARGLSQAALGKLLGVSQARVAEIEAAPGSVSLDQWFRIFSALDVEFVLRTKDGVAAATPDRAPGMAADKLVDDMPRGRW